MRALAPWLLMLGCSAGEVEPEPESTPDTEVAVDTELAPDTDLPVDTDVEPEPEPDFAVWIPAFVPSGTHPQASRCDWMMPDRFSCSGSNPRIRWTGIPATAAGLVLVFDDPDFNDYPHWAVWNIPATQEGLDAAISGASVSTQLPAGAVENDSYFGSCPPDTHRYRWRLWAISEAISVNANQGDAALFADVEAAAQAVAVDMVEVCHLYDPS